MERLIATSLIGFVCLSEIALCVISLVLNKSRIAGCTKNCVLGLIFGSLSAFFLICTAYNWYNLSIYWSYLLFVVIFGIAALPFCIIAICKALRTLRNQDDRVRRTPKAKVEEKPLSAADEIMKFKELLDKGVITEEEFTTKKKQILER